MNNFKNYILLYGGIFIYSLSILMSKIASKYPIRSNLFFYFYGFGLLLLAVYALLWQQILKRFTLSTAYSNRAFVTILGMFWSVLIFHEEIMWNMIIGAICIMLGIWFAVNADEE